MRKICAFTLAEVLVTLGIIGVVSALTLPTLVKNHQRQVFVTQLHKVYNDLQQASERLITDSNAVSLRETRMRRVGPQYLLNNYFKTVKTGSVDDCFADEYANLNGVVLDIADFAGANASCAVVASGASICIEVFGSNYKVLTDINGLDGPNILGRDLFELFLSRNGSVFVPGDLETLVASFGTDCSAATEASDYGACFAKILNDGWKMDY